MTKKYIFENGVMKINPEYQKEQNKQGNPTSITNPEKSIAIVSSTKDIESASKAMKDGSGKEMQLADSTTSTMDIMQDDDFLDRFGTKKKMDGGKLLDDLSDVFARYEIPIGLSNKLMALTQYKLNFIIDDSGSMNDDTDSTVSSATDYIKSRCKKNGKSTSDNLSRWEEAEDRIHIMIDMLKFIPIDPITVSFLNREDKLILNHQGRTPEKFGADAHEAISKAFKHAPSGRTPTYSKLSAAFNSTQTPTMHYLFTDGTPSDKTESEVAALIMNRPHPEMTPLTFVTCTNDDAEAEWMKDIEEKAKFVSEVDDFNDEKTEVLKDQGPGFPFSRGFWLISHLVAAINPDDLDAMDESVPFSKKTIDDLMGRKTTEQEYQMYFRGNPNEPKYVRLYNEFKREDVLAKQIIAQFCPQGVMNPQQFAPQYFTQGAPQQTFFAPPQTVPGVQPNFQAPPPALNRQ